MTPRAHVRYSSRMVTEARAREIADRTGTDLKSVMRRLLGWPVRGRAGVRIDAMLLALGVVPNGVVPKVLE